MTLTDGSLFSGIGGFDLGLERAGMKVIWQSEIDEFASQVLKKHWPDVPNLGDITKVDWTNIERPDVICGGYPCQPFSTAGKRNGKNDPRHLWPEMLNAISILRPNYAIMENVRGHLSLGFGRVLGDLAQIGYDAEWQVIPAAAVGAPHKRERVFIVAYPAELFGYGVKNKFVYSERSKTISEFRNGSRSNTNAKTKWLFEPSLGRVANGIPDRVDRLRSLGNAIVPQVAELVGALVVEHSQN